MKNAQMEASDIFSSMSTVSIVYGIILIIIAMFLFTNTGQTYMFATTLLGIYLLVKGLIDFVAVFNTRNENRVGILLSSAVYVLAGFFVVMNPLFSGTFLVTFILYIIAFSFVFGGVVSFFSDAKVMGIVNIAIGVLMFFSPQIFAWGLVWLIAMVILLGGIFTIIFGAMANSVSREIKEG